MTEASTFDSEYFMELLRDEVKTLAVERYEGAEANQLARAFEFWVIKQISPSLSPEEVEAARSISEISRPGDENIDAAWIDFENRTFFIMQSKYKEPPTSDAEETKISPRSFGVETANDLWKGFERIRLELENQANPKNSKQIRLVSLYKKALETRLRIEIIIAISGRATRSLLSEVSQINGLLNNRQTFPGHHCTIYDLDALNRVVSNNYAPPPEVVYLHTTKQFVLQNEDGSIYALTATVSANDLVNIRRENGLNIYHSNFRFLLKRGVAAPKIRATLSDGRERKNFWRYNNGVTVCCSKLSLSSSDPQEQVWRIHGFQVVNGLQTIETLSEYEGRPEVLKGAELLVRVIPTGDESSGGSPDGPQALEEHIAEYSNSQTPITARDLRANDQVQRFIERELLQIYETKYVRKYGDASELGQPSRRVVKNDIAAQVALSFWYGMSREAKAKKKLIFERMSSATPGYYEMVFSDVTTPEYILFPYLMWYSQKRFFKTVKKRSRRGIFKGLDLLAIAVVGDAFRQVTILSAKPEKSDQAKTILQKAIQRAQSINIAQAKELWRPIFEDLETLVQSERQVQASNLGLDVSEVSARNVIIKFDYTRPELRNQIWALPHVKRLTEKLRGEFTA